MAFFALPGATVIAQPKVREDCFNENQVYRGIGTHIPVLESESNSHYETAEECQFACYGKSQCEFFTFVNSNFEYERQTSCYLYEQEATLTPVSEIPHLADGSTYISGPKRCATLRQFTCHYDAKISAPVHPEFITGKFPDTYSTGAHHDIECKKGFHGKVRLVCFADGPYTVVNKCEKARIYDCRVPHDEIPQYKDIISGDFPETYSTFDDVGLGCGEGYVGEVNLICSQYEVLIREEYYSIQHTCVSPPPEQKSISSWVGLACILLMVAIINILLLSTLVRDWRRKGKRAENTSVPLNRLSDTNVSPNHLSFDVISSIRPDAIQ